MRGDFPLLDSRVSTIYLEMLFISLELRFISLEHRLTRSSVCLIVFTLCFIEYFVRYFTDKPVKSVEQPAKRRPMTQNLQLMSAGLTFTILVIFVRCVQGRTYLSPVH